MINREMRCNLNHVVMKINRIFIPFPFLFLLKRVYYCWYRLIYWKRNKFCLKQRTRLCPGAIGGPICAVKKFVRNPRNSNALKLLSTSTINRFRVTSQRSSLVLIYSERLAHLSLHNSGLLRVAFYNPSLRHLYEIVTKI